MTIYVDRLRELVLEAETTGHQLKNEPLYIKFPRHSHESDGDEKERAMIVHDTLTFNTADGTTVAVDIDADGHVLGIELI